MDFPCSRHAMSFRGSAQPGSRCLCRQSRSRVHDEQSQAASGIAEQHSDASVPASSCRKTSAFERHLGRGLRSRMSPRKRSSSGEQCSPRSAMTHDHSCNRTPGRVLFAYPACRLPKRDMDSLRINCLPGTRFGGLPSLGVYPVLRLQSSVLVNNVFLAQEEHCDGLSMRERVRGGEKRRPWAPFALIEEMILDRVVRAHTPGRLHETPGKCLEDIWSMILRPGEHV